MESQQLRSVFLLWQTHELEGGESDEKLLGVYSTEEAANSRASAARRLPGFCLSPDGFQVVRYVVDRDEWTEGFVTS